MFSSYKMSQYFPKPYEPFGGDINVEVDLSNYVTNADIKNITDEDSSNFALKTNLANLKTKVDKLDIDKLKSLPNNLSNLITEVDKLDIDKLAPVPTDLNKLSDVVKNEVVKKTEYNTKIPDISNSATKSNLNAKVNELKNEIASITGLATTFALTAVENKIISISNLVKKQIMIQNWRN